MPGTSPILGLPMADQDSDFVTDFPDAVDIPRTTGLEKFTVPRFANITERNTKIPAPVAGMMCYLNDTGTLQMHNGYVWVGDTAPVDCTLLNGFVPDGNDPVYKPRMMMDHRGLVTLDGSVFGNAVKPVNTAICSFNTNYSLTIGAAIPSFASLIVGGAAMQLRINNGQLQIASSNHAVGVMPIQGSWRVNFLAVR